MHFFHLPFTAIVTAMANASSLPFIAFCDYVRDEPARAVKHEWLDGGVNPMASGTPEHSAMAAAIIAQLSAQLSGKPCRVFSSDARVRVLATGLATYPDISIVCGALQVDPDDANSIVNPSVLIAVLSLTTESYDRGKKLAHYKQIVALQHYVVVAHDRPYIEWFTRAPASVGAGVWLHRAAGASEKVELAAIGSELIVDDVYFNPLA